MSFLFCYGLKKLSENDNETIIAIRSLFNSESENLMKANDKLLNYQNSFKKCNVTAKKMDYALNQDQLNSIQSQNSLSKLRYSQIKYSKVKSNKQDKNQSDDKAELTCHQDDLESSNSSTNSNDELTNALLTHLNELDKSNDKLKINNSNDISGIKKHRNTKIKKVISKRPFDKLDKHPDKQANKSIRKQSSAKSHKITKENYKSNPNYNLNFKSKFNPNYNLKSSSNQTDYNSSSPDEQTTDNRNLIDPKNTVDKLYLDKLKNKFIEPYWYDSSYLTDTFDDVTEKGNCINCNDAVCFECNQDFRNLVRFTNQMIPSNDRRLNRSIDSYLGELKKHHDERYFIIKI